MSSIFRHKMKFLENPVYGIFYHFYWHSPNFFFFFLRLEMILIITKISTLIYVSSWWIYQNDKINLFETFWPFLDYPKGWLVVTIYIYKYIHIFVYGRHIWSQLLRYEIIYNGMNVLGKVDFRSNNHKEIWKLCQPYPFHY